MAVRPVALNATIACLFAIGSALFVLGSVPAYANAVGATADGVTYFVGSIFFTSASFSQLVQAQTPAMTNVDMDSQHTRAPLRFWAWLPHDRNWLAAITQFPGTLFFNISTLAALIQNLTVKQQDRRDLATRLLRLDMFLIASVFGILALGRFLSFRPRALPWHIAWLNMIGSILFMFSALASYVLPTTGEFINSQFSLVGTLLGAVCFFLGAILLFPAWQHAMRAAAPSPKDPHRATP